MKTSLYNFYSKEGNKNIILNLSSWKTVLLNEDVYFKLLNKNLDFDINIFKQLVKNRMIVENNENEIEIFLAKFNKALQTKTLNITIMATTFCNFQCTYCYENYIPEKIDNIFCLKIMKFIESNIHHSLKVYIDWFGGEPLLAFDVIAKLSELLKKLCAKHGKPYLSGMTTNGYLLSVDKMKILLKGNVYFYQITIDGTKEKHNEYRKLKNGKGTFDTIWNNLILIKKQIHTYFEIVLRCNITSNNFSEALKLKKIFLDTFGEDNRFKILFYPVKDWGGENIKELENYLINYDFLNDKHLISTFETIGDSIYSRICNAKCKYSFIVDPKGNVYQCSHYNQNVEKILGNIDTCSLEQLILNKTDKYLFDRKCKSCQYLPLCLVEECPLKNLKFTLTCKQNIEKRLKMQLKAWSKKYD